jgi:hypothetical protein
MPALRAKESDMDDLNELLTLAARACGHTDCEWQDGVFYVRASLVHKREWNPLKPGDGAEMEDKLRIGVAWLPDGEVACNADGVDWKVERIADHPDEGTARRWASLRVAAAIGRSMK